MGAIASQITSLTIFYSTVYSDVDQRKHQSSASLAFVRGIHPGLNVIKWSMSHHICTKKVPVLRDEKTSNDMPQQISEVGVLMWNVKLDISGAQSQVMFFTKIFTIDTLKFVLEGEVWSVLWEFKVWFVSNTKFDCIYKKRFNQNVSVNTIFVYTVFVLPLCVEQRRMEERWDLSLADDRFYANKKWVSVIPGISDAASRLWHRLFRSSPYVRTNRQ